jgi:hypothetical protein
MKPPRSDFEWTFSTRVRERDCQHCRAKTSAFLTDLRTGIRKPFCSTCFFAAVKSVTGLQAAATNLNQRTIRNGVRKMKNAIYRQGDVLIRRIQSLPKQTAQPRLTGILAYGEVTGHAHKVEDLAKAEVLEIERGLFLRVGEEGVRVVHEEHAPITLPPGNYEVEIQREYTPEAIRNVAD